MSELIVEEEGCELLMRLKGVIDVVVEVYDGGGDESSIE